MTQFHTNFDEHVDQAGGLDDRARTAHTSQQPGLYSPHEYSSTYPDVVPAAPPPVSFGSPHGHTSLLEQHQSTSIAGEHGSVHDGAYAHPYPESGFEPRALYEDHPACVEIFSADGSFSYSSDRTYENTASPPAVSPLDGPFPSPVTFHGGYWHPEAPWYPNAQQHQYPLSLSIPETQQDCASSPLSPAYGWGEQPVARRSTYSSLAPNVEFMASEAARSGAGVSPSTEAPTNPHTYAGTQAQTQSPMSSPVPIAQFGAAPPVHEAMVPLPLSQSHHNHTSSYDHPQEPHPFLTPVHAHSQQSMQQLGYVTAPEQPTDYHYESLPPGDNSLSRAPGRAMERFPIPSPTPPPPNSHRTSRGALVIPQMPQQGGGTYATPYLRTVARQFPQPQAPTPTQIPPNAHPYVRTYPPVPPPKSAFPPQDWIIPSQAAADVRTPDPPKKQPVMACFFCRGRKIACGGPAVDNEEGDRTCRQCKRRGNECVYPKFSRRGFRRRTYPLPEEEEEALNGLQGSRSKSPTMHDTHRMRRSESPLALKLRRAKSAQRSTSSPDSGASAMVDEFTPREYEDVGGSFMVKVEDADSLPTPIPDVNALRV